MKLLTKKQRGRLIRTRRVELGVTQEELATRMRCAQSHISYLERGMRGASREDLNQLSRHLNLPLPALIFEREPRAKASRAA